MTPEVKVKVKVRAIAKKYGMFLRAPVAGPFGRSGQLDFYGCYRGLYVGIECKATPKDKPTALQEAEMQAISDAGGVCFLIHKENVQELERWLQYGGHR